MVFNCAITMWHQLSLPRETALKMIRLGELSLDGSKTPVMLVSMPGQRHPDKTTLSVYLTRTLMQRVRRLAQERRQTVTQVVEAALTEQTREVVLRPEDYEQIAEETRQAMGTRVRTARTRSKT